MPKKGVSIMSFSKIHRCLIAVCMLGPLLCAAQDAAKDRATYVSFRVPRSIGTYPESINNGLTVTGYYISPSGITEGFVRSEDGAITTFSVPGSVLTEPVSINTAGDITGYYETAGLGTSQGFVRSADGRITTFGNALGLLQDNSFGAQPIGINTAGEIAGNYASFPFASHVFVRSVTGAITTFSLTQGGSYSTIATGVNASGTVIGYWSEDGTNIGFLRYADRGVTNFAVPGSTGTSPTGINADGTIVGCYSTRDMSKGAPIGPPVYHDFVRSPEGVITPLNLPGTISGCGVSINFPLSLTPQVIDINDAGTITGYYINATTHLSYGFVRSGDGEVTTFTQPGSMFTMPTSINDSGVITGYYSIGSHTWGFLRAPNVDHDHEGIH